MRSKMLRLGVWLASASARETLARPLPASEARTEAGRPRPSRCAADCAATATAISSLREREESPGESAPVSESSSASASASALAAPALAASASLAAESSAAGSSADPPATASSSAESSPSCPAPSRAASSAPAPSAPAPSAVVSSAVASSEPTSCPALSPAGCSASEGPGADWPRPMSSGSPESEFVDLLTDLFPRVAESVWTGLTLLQGRRDSNPQPPVLETGALPIAPLPFAIDARHIDPHGPTAPQADINHRHQSVREIIGQVDPPSTTDSVHSAAAVAHSVHR